MDTSSRAIIVFLVAAAIIAAAACGNATEPVGNSNYLTLSVSGSRAGRVSVTASQVDTFAYDGAYGDKPLLAFQRYDAGATTDWIDVVAISPRRDGR